MSTLLRKVMFKAGLTTLIIMVAAVSGWCQQGLKKKIDSLFMIASSAELKVRDQVEPAKDSIAALGVDAVPILIDKLTTKSARERLTVIQILKKIGSPAVPYLVRALKNPDDLVVQRVCWALGDIGDSAAVDPLIAVGTHPKWHVREQALGALGNIGSKRASQAVLLGFGDEIGQVRKAAVVSAGKLELREATGRLVHMLGDEFYGVRLSAVEALLMMDTTEVMVSLADSMVSANTLVGDLGCHILGRIGGDKAIEILINEIASRSPTRRVHAAIAIINADPLDNCGYRQGIISGETDRLVLLKINSAIYSVTNAGKETQE